MFAVNNGNIDIQDWESYYLEELSMFKLILSTIIMTIVLSTSYFSNPSFAVSFNEKHNFCAEAGQALNYTEQSQFNACMENAAELIKQYGSVNNFVKSVQKEANEYLKKLQDEYVPPIRETCDVGYRKCIGANKGRRNNILCRCLHFKESGSWKQKNQRTCEKFEQKVKGLKPHDDAPAYDRTGNC